MTWVSEIRHCNATAPTTGQRCIFAAGHRGEHFMHDNEQDYPDLDRERAAAMTSSWTGDAIRDFILNPDDPQACAAYEAVRETIKRQDISTIERVPLQLLALVEELVKERERLRAELHRLRLDFASQLTWFAQQDEHTSGDTQPIATTVYNHLVRLAKERR
jgi:hypothetical protein